MKQDYLKNIIDYNRKTGSFIWKVKIGNRIKSGDVAGSFNKASGYIHIQINGKKYQAHRLAWLYEYGYMPKEHIDHKNHNRKDNRITNLRDVKQKENNKNASKRKDNTSGVTGVHWCKQHNRWKSIINVDGKNKFLGRFVDFSDAVNARKNAEVLYGFSKNHGKGE